ncbi:MAG: bifunctional diaminohydroxyphosphoribosylaminopyrimidine deaminase/5-amino-6-(5-phosphoribosylamino)uracil reductase RibD [Bacteroidales bacterium]|nr:bifunctional diaminohydroxyphosphoribosylaminopyrimidine deaminase/5-amino-6-(5-phosphoribosylamino)uracil reductase RibD [Bacteroidales bacterium]
MALHSEFMLRCLQLARKGEGFTKPNPMVGAVVVYNNKIIGEGFHRRYGDPHAEVNAIVSVKDPTLLAGSTLYVSLEPCAHYGRTPPCVELIIKKKIPKVVIAVGDPNPKVSGKGIAMLREQGVEVVVGVLEEEAREMNRFFFINQLYARPYVILKWAQSSDGFMDRLRSSRAEKPAKISNELTHAIVHKFRTRVEGILVGTNTALLDNPRLTARNWFGDHPTRVVIDRENKIPMNSAIFDESVPTILFTRAVSPTRESIKNLKQIEIDFSGNTNLQILNHLYQQKIYSLLVEGGKQLLSSFIEKELWDEAYVEFSSKMLLSGIKAPTIHGCVQGARNYLDSTQLHLKNKITRNFL